jgi:hypothetical protein
LEVNMTDEYKAMLSAVAEAVLVVSGELELVDYAIWEELVDWICDLHEQLNDKKPAPRGGTPA